MGYETFVQEMLDRFPELSGECHVYMDQREPLPYVALGCVLIPLLEDCLAARNTAEITKVCEFLERAALRAREDLRLAELIRIEIGEWLPEARERTLLLAHLGPNTKKVCSYHIDRLQD